jgi:hypothetical protein
MGRTCGTHRTNEKTLRILVENHEVKKQPEDRGVSWMGRSGLNSTGSWQTQVTRSCEKKSNKIKGYVRAASVDYR